MILSPTSGQLTTKFPHSALVNKKHKKFGRRPKARNIYADKKETNVKHLSLNSLLWLSLPQSSTVVQLKFLVWKWSQINSIVLEKPLVLKSGLFPSIFFLEMLTHWTADTWEQSVHYASEIGEFSVSLLHRILRLAFDSLWLFFIHRWSLFQNILLQSYSFLLLLEFLIKTLWEISFIIFSTLFIPLYFLLYTLW